MNTQVFHQWSETFCSQVTKRLLLIMYDGHMSHILIEKAREEDITILKLLPHVTDKIQPLDVSCFGLLKRAWTELLNERMNVLGRKESISKSTLSVCFLKYGITGIILGHLELLVFFLED